MNKSVSFWEEESFFAAQDFIVAGAGLVGLWSALEIKNKYPKSRVTIIERGCIPNGASTRNAGFACFGSPSEILHDAALFGEEDMWRIVEMRYKGISKIRKTFKEKKIGYDECGGFECFNNAEEIEQVTDKLSWLNKGMKDITGQKDSFAFADKKLAKFNFYGFDSMIENKHEGGLHSGKLVKALTKKVQKAGIQILNGLEITNWKDSGTSVSIKCGSYLFAAKKLVVCTNALATKLLSGYNLKPARGQVLVTAPIKGLKMKGTFHFDKGFYYFRNVGNRVLVGGARNTAFEQEETTEMDITENIQEKLEQFLTDHIINQPYHITHRWSGIMGMTETKLPMVKEVSTNIVAAIACNGMGVALSPVIAEQVADLVCG